MQLYHQTELGRMYLGDSLALLASLQDGAANLVVTSPPFALCIPKEYGNQDQAKYVEWFRPFGSELKRVLAANGSLVIDIAGVWNRGLPTRSLYHFELLLMLCRELGFHLAQEFYWWSPNKLPTPTWATMQRVRVKDAVNCLWWLSPTPWPKANNRRVLAPYSPMHRHHIKHGRKTFGRSHSGHLISKHFCRDNCAAIPPNLIALPNPANDRGYLRLCREQGIKPHPARFPQLLPEFFIRLLTDRGDLVVDPFAGSCVTGAVAERLGRRWICGDLVEEYLAGGKQRLDCPRPRYAKKQVRYELWRPGALWEESAALAQQEARAPLPADGGKDGHPLRKRRASETQRGALPPGHRWGE